MTLDGATGTLIGAIGTAGLTVLGSAYLKHRDLKASRELQDDNQQHKQVADDVQFLLGKAKELEAQFDLKRAEIEKECRDRIEEMRKEFDAKSAAMSLEWQAKIDSMKQDWHLREVEMSSQITINEKEIGRLTQHITDMTLSHTQAIAEWRQRSMQQQIDHQAEIISKQDNHYREKSDMSNEISKLQQQIIDMRRAMESHQIKCPDTTH